MAHEADHIPREGFINGFALAAKNLVRAGEAKLVASASVHDRHVAFKPARADAYESEPVAMPGVHVGLDFENEAREGGVFRRDGAAICRARARRRGQFEKRIE